MPPCRCHLWFGSRASVFTAEGERIEVGGVRIFSRSLDIGRVSIPQTFSELDPGYCSLGQEANYYEPSGVCPVRWAIRFFAACATAYETHQFMMPFATKKAFKHHYSDPCPRAISWRHSRER